MKKLLSITLLSVFSCTHKDHDFQSFVNHLEILPVPISFETIDYPELSTSKKYDKDLFERFRPNNASDVYVSKKVEFGEKVGAGVEVVHLSADVSEEEVISEIEKGAW